MKLKNILMLLTLMLGAFAFVACDDDDSTPNGLGKGTIENADVVGTYKGMCHLTTAHINKNYIDNTFILALAEDGTLTATFINPTWGTATLTGINAKNIAGGKGYILEGGEGQFVMNNPRDPENPTMTFSCYMESGAVSEDKGQLRATIVAHMDVEGGHGDMIFNFQTEEMSTE